MSATDRDAHLGTLEAEMAGALERALDDSDMPYICGAAKDERSRLCRYVNDCFAANTASIAQQKRADWGRYSMFMCKGAALDITEVP